MIKQVFANKTNSCSRAGCGEGGKKTNTKSVGLVRSCEVEPVKESSA